MMQRMANSFSPGVGVICEVDNREHQIDTNGINKFSLELHDSLHEYKSEQIDAHAMSFSEVEKSKLNVGSDNGKNLLRSESIEDYIPDKGRRGKQRKPRIAPSVQTTKNVLVCTSSCPSCLLKPITRSYQQNNRPLVRNEIPKRFLHPGIEMLRITHRKKVKRMLRLDIDTNRLYWNTKSTSFLEIEKIKYIRLGDNARNYREEFGVAPKFKDLWITVIYHNYSKSNNIKALHVIALNKTDYNTFLYTLNNMVYFMRQLQSGLCSSVNSDSFIQYHWNNTVTNDGKLTFKSALKLALKLHIYISKESLSRQFRYEDKEAKGFLNFLQYKSFIRKLGHRSEFKAIFERYCDGNVKDLMNKKDFKKFLCEEQKERICDECALDHIFNEFSSNDQTLNFDEFTSFLMSLYTNGIRNLVEDYTKPLNEYFISSSHNTYLLGRQFNGISSIEGYIRALQRGCRCIEIDVWDGDNGPIVTHGMTFTGSIDFKSVVETVRKYAFITSPFPVIISLEVRCSEENQMKCVNILKEVLGSTLLHGRLDNNQTTLPSPLELKHRILLKVKKSRMSSIPTSYIDNSMYGSQSTTTSSFSEDSTFTYPLVSSSTNPTSGQLSSGSLSSSSSNTTQVIMTKIMPRAKRSVPIITELSSMAFYTVGLKFRNFSLPESKTFNHCFSFSDRTVSKMLKEITKFNAIMKHNRNYLMRIYPSVYRFKSDNFNPLAFWSLGCQIAATNWQVYDAGQQINEALFNVGTCSGYILKPKSLRMHKDKFRKTKDFQNVMRFDKLNFIELNIISAQQLPKSKDMKVKTFDPYIEVELYSGKVLDAEYEMGSTNMIKMGESLIKINPDSMANHGSEFDSQKLINLGSPSLVFRTSSVLQNGFNPIWNEKLKCKFCANKEDMVFLRFLVKCNTPDKSDVLLGIYCCRLSYLKQGYRHLPIYDLQGEEYIYSSLFFHVNYGECE